MTGILVSFISSFLQLVGSEARAEIMRRKQKEAAAKKAMIKATKEIERKQAEQKRIHSEYLARQAKLKEEIRIAREKWAEHWKETRPDPRPLDANPYAETDPNESNR